jgi:uncharacterized protein YxeA
MKIKKDTAIYLVILLVVAVIILSIFILKNINRENVDKELAECIGKNSELYSQLGCSACKIQEQIFGENYQYINSIDCYYENELCMQKQISATPTWIIQGIQYKGVRNIEELKRLTGC